MVRCLPLSLSLPKKATRAPLDLAVDAGMALVAALADGSTSCQRKCTLAPSLLIMNTSAGHPGLGDLSYRLEAEANLAASLCAQFVPPAPSEALRRLHNNGLDLPSDVPWSRYVRFLPHEHTARVLGSVLVDTYGEWRRDQTEDAPLKLLSTSVSDVLKHWGQASAAVAAGRRFEWELRRLSFWDWSRPLQKRIVDMTGEPPPKIEFYDKFAIGDLASYCDYGTIHVSRSVKKLVHRFRRTLDLAHGDSHISDLITLHVRRGDTVGRCNSSVPAVLQFLGCSTALDKFEAAQPSGSLAGIRLVFFTDETDPSYLGELKDALTALPRFADSRVNVTHGDPVVAEWAHTVPDGKGGRLPDNYEVYAAAGTATRALLLHTSPPPYLLLPPLPSRPRLRLPPHQPHASHCPPQPTSCRAPGSRSRLSAATASLSAPRASTTTCATRATAARRGRASRIGSCRRPTSMPAGAAPRRAANKGTMTRCLDVPRVSCGSRLRLSCVCHKCTTLRLTIYYTTKSQDPGIRAGH